MPTTNSAKKRLRQNVKRAAANKERRSSMRTFEKKIRAAIAAGDKAGAVALLPLVQQQLDKAARHRILHANTAANHKSRLARKIASM
jgi:small subunit ribosomal protein S20